MGLQDRDFEILVAVPVEARAVHLGPPEEGVQMNGNMSSAYDALFGPLSASENGAGEEVDNDNPSPSREAKGLETVLRFVGPPALQELMDAPVHAMPPLTDLCTAFLDRLLEAGPAAS